MPAWYKCPICGHNMKQCMFDGNTCEFDWDSRPGFWGDTHTWDGRVATTQKDK